MRKPLFCLLAVRLLVLLFVCVSVVCFDKIPPILERKISEPSFSPEGGGIITTNDLSNTAIESPGIP